MKFIHILLILIVILYLMQDGSVLAVIKPSNKFCQTYQTMDGPIEVCRENYVNKWTDKEAFDIPMSPTQLCETRCATNLDHAQLLMNKHMLLEDCIKKCHNL